MQKLFLIFALLLFLTLTNLYAVSSVSYPTDTTKGKIIIKTNSRYEHNPKFQGVHNNANRTSGWRITQTYTFENSNQAPKLLTAKNLIKDLGKDSKYAPRLKKTRRMQTIVQVLLGTVTVLTILSTFLFTIPLKYFALPIFLGIGVPYTIWNIASKNSLRRILKDYNKDIDNMRAKK